MPLWTNKLLSRLSPLLPRVRILPPLFQFQFQSFSSFCSSRYPLPRPECVPLCLSSLLLLLLTLLNLHRLLNLAYGRGRGIWPTTPMKTRIALLQKFAEGLKTARAQIVEILMWEICKTKVGRRRKADRKRGWKKKRGRGRKRGRGKGSIPLTPLLFSFFFLSSSSS